MKLSRTNKHCLSAIKNGEFDLDSMQYHFKRQLSIYREANFELSEGDMLDLASMYFPMDKDTKIIKVTKQVQENAKLINFKTIKDKVTDINLPFKNAILMLNNDDDGMVKVNVLRDHQNKLMLTYLWIYNVKESGGEISANGYRTLDNSFLHELNGALTEPHQFIIKLMVYLFYGDVTFKKIPAKTSIRLTSLTKLKNDTKTGIWFANSLWKQRISTEGFKVRGHFRLQPHGSGMKLRKLKWIETFEKKGYNRDATRTKFEGK